VKLTQEEESIFEIAFYLRIPVYVLMEEMTYEEFLGWCAYFKKKPFGWQEDQRAFYLMTSFGVKVKPENVFPSLKQMKESHEKDTEKGLSKSVLFQHMLKAVGGDKIEL